MSIKKQVLFICPNKEINENVETFFEEKNVEVISFLNPQDFYIKKQPRGLEDYAIVFIDYDLPEDLANQFIDRFYTTPKIPPIYLFAENLNKDGNLQKRPSLIFIAKPINLDRLWDDQIEFLF